MRCSFLDGHRDIAPLPQPTQSTIVKRSDLNYKVAKIVQGIKEKELIDSIFQRWGIQIID